MSLFRRKRTDDVAVTPEEDVATEKVAEDEEVAEDGPARPGLSARPDGPWDVSEVGERDTGYVDLGALRLEGRDGMELRLEVDEASGRVTTATVQLAGSAVQLQVFAAPRTTGIWEEIRAEIAAGITRQGGTADDVPGAFGRELLARVPVKSADGRAVHQAVRFTGVDGPRWFLRAVFHGAAAYDHDAALALEAVVRDVVVVRGPDAMAPRELLALRLPEAWAPQTVGPDTAAPDTASPEAATPAEGAAREPLEPFRRGPEITEIH